MEERWVSDAAYVPRIVRPENQDPTGVVIVLLVELLTVAVLWAMGFFKGRSVDHFSELQWQIEDAECSAVYPEHMQ